MKRLIFVGLLGLCAASVVYAWQYSAQTTWDGSHHQSGGTNFTPGSTTAYVTMSAPDLYDSGGGCPTEDPVPFGYFANAKLKNTGFPGTYYIAEHECGGCAYYNNASVTTTQVWRIEAYIDRQVGDQDSSQGPVTAYAANPQVLCSGARPGGE